MFNEYAMASWLFAPIMDGNTGLRFGIVKTKGVSFVPYTAYAVEKDAIVDVYVPGDPETKFRVRITLESNTKARKAAKYLEEVIAVVCNLLGCTAYTLFRDRINKDFQDEIHAYESSR